MLPSVQSFTLFHLVIDSELLELQIVVVSIVDATVLEYTLLQTLQIKNW